MNYFIHLKGDRVKVSDKPVEAGYKLIFAIQYDIFDLGETGVKDMTYEECWKEAAGILWDSEIAERESNPLWLKEDVEKDYEVKRYVKAAVSKNAALYTLHALWYPERYEHELFHFPNDAEGTDVIALFNHIAIESGFKKAIKRLYDND